MSQAVDWVFEENVEVPDTFRAQIGGETLVAETLYRRGFQEVEAAQAFLDPYCYQPTSWQSLPDCEEACRIIEHALKNNRKILIWGDFDVDGQTATTLLVEALRELDARVSFHIPVRAEESHGITRGVLEGYLEQGFDLLLTCDTGISEHNNLKMVKSAGKTVIVTDHHILADTLPPADAVLNPQRIPKGHPLRTLPGVGVAYKLIEGLFHRLHTEFDKGHYQELAALGIVADVAELRGDTRYLLQMGLRHLRQTRRLGLQTLYQNANLNPQNLNEDHIGFQIAPRLNAVGRLGDANSMVEFLTTTDSGRARVLAAKIEGMNATRRFATRQVELAAEAKLQSSPDDRHAPAIVLHQPNWPGGVVGIVASRLVERYHKPVILLTGEDPVHGSARSVPGIHITQAIGSQAGLFNTFGGHPMAAGLSLDDENLLDFKRGFLKEIAARRKAVEFRPELKICQSLSLDGISPDLVEQINRLAPFGPGNPSLNFLIKDLSISSDTDVGQQGEHRKVVAQDAVGNEFSFIWWNGGDEPLPEAHFDLICQLTSSDYKGTLQVSAEWIDFRLSEKGEQEIAKQQFHLVDKRQNPFPLRALKAFLAEDPEAVVWGEGDISTDIPALQRHDLIPSTTLVIWTAPPSQVVLEDVLRQVKPQTIIVFAVEPQPTSPKAFMNRIAGLAKFASRTYADGVPLKRLASACAADPQTVRIGLQLWEAMGNLQVVFTEDRVKIKLTQSSPSPSSIEIYRTILQNLVEETRSYREYFRSGSLKTYFRNKLV